MVVRVLIAEDQVQLREALVDLLGADPGLEVVASVGDATAAVTECERLQPDVAVLDVKMPGGGGVTAASAMAVCSPTTSVVAFSAYDDDGARSAMQAAGAAKYLIKGGPIDDLLTAIHEVAGNSSASDR